MGTNQQGPSDLSPKSLAAMYVERYFRAYDSGAKPKRLNSIINEAYAAGVGELFRKGLSWGFVKRQKSIEGFVALVLQAAWACDSEGSPNGLSPILREALADSEKETALVNGLLGKMAREAKTLNAIVRKAVLARKKTLNAADHLPVVEKFVDGVQELFRTGVLTETIPLTPKGQGCTDNAIRRIKRLLRGHKEHCGNFFESCKGSYEGVSGEDVLNIEKGIAKLLTKIANALCRYEEVSVEELLKNCLKDSVEPLTNLLNALLSVENVLRTADPAIVKEFVDVLEDVLRFVLCLEAYLREANGVEEPTSNAEARLKDLLEDYEDPDDDSSES